MRSRKWFLALILAFQVIPWLLVAFDQFGGFRALVSWLQPLVLRSPSHAGALVTIVNFVIAYWWFIALVAALLSASALAIHVLWDSSRPYWRRIAWVVSFYFAMFIAVPLFCVLSLSRPVRPAVA